MPTAAQLVICLLLLLLLQYGLTIDRIFPHIYQCAMFPNNDATDIRLAVMSLQTLLVTSVMPCTGSCLHL